MLIFMPAAERFVLYMQQEKSKAVISWCFVVICMGIIFWLSSRTADESARQSSSVLQWLIEHLGNIGISEFIVRKTAHLLEFTGLCFLFNVALYYTRGKVSPILSTILTSLYAVTDEVHQLFVVGRSCELRDWAIDTCGAILGAVGTMLIFLIISKISAKSIDTESI